MQYINIQGDVSEQTLEDVKQAIANPDKEITLLINSLGGSLPVGLQIFDLLSTCPPEVHTFYARCTGNVASSATLILCGVKKENRYASKNTCFLIHNPLISLYGTQNLGDIKQLANTMDSASNQIKDVYRLRTNLTDDMMDNLMNNEVEFWADKALEYGLIGNIEQIVNKKQETSNYNKKIKEFKRDMKKSFLKELTNRIVKALLNDAFVAEDGTELEISALEVGGTCDKDGIFVIDGNTITVEGGVIVDLIPAVEVENEGEEAPKEEEKQEDAPNEEVKPEEAEKVAEEVAEAVEEVETVEDATEVAEEVKQIVEEELVNYKKMKDLVDKCGGIEKLEKLANAKHESKVFSTKNVAKNEKRSIADLMALKKK